MHPSLNAYNQTYQKCLDSFVMDMHSASTVREKRGRREDSVDAAVLEYGAQAEEGLHGCEDSRRKAWRPAPYEATAGECI